MALIKLIERNQEGGKGTHMWTVARTHGSQGCFFSALFSISEVCVREHLAEMCREPRRERERARRLFLSAARLTVCGRANEYVHNEPGRHVQFNALLPH